MSLILDALNKADREREPTPPIPTIAAPYVSPSSSANSLPGWVYAIAGALVVSVVVMLVLLFKVGSMTTSENSVGEAYLQSSSTQTNRPRTGAAEVQPIGERESQALDSFTQYELNQHNQAIVEIAKAQKQSTPPIVSEAVASLYGEAQPKVVSAKATAINELKQADKNNMATKAASAPAEKVTPAPAKPVEPLVSDEELAELWRDAQRETLPPEPPKTKENQFAELPYLYQLPESFQERIPTLMYQNHIFSARASAVIINGVTYKKGDLIADRLKIEAITEEDLVLSYMEKPFKLAALSSWVKMN